MSSSVDGAVSMKLHTKLEPNNVDDQGAAKYKQSSQNNITDTVSLMETG